MAKHARQATKATPHEPPAAKPPEPVEHPMDVEFAAQRIRPDDHDLYSHAETIGYFDLIQRQHNAAGGEPLSTQAIASQLVPVIAGCRASRTPFAELVACYYAAGGRERKPAPAPTPVTYDEEARTLTLPVAVNPSRKISTPRHVDVGRLTADQGSSLAGIREGLRATHETLANDRPVVTNADAVRWVLEQAAKTD